MRATGSPISAMAAGDEAEVVRKDREITTQQAAELLGISRPTVIKLIEEGALRAVLTASAPTAGSACATC